MRRFARCGQWGREAPWLTERGSWRERRTQRPSSFPPPGSGQSGARQLVFWKLETVEIRPIMFCLRRSDAFDCKNIVTCTPRTPPPAFAVVNGRHPLGRGETGFILPLQNGWKRVASAVEAVAYGATQWGRRASIIFGDDERSKRGEEEVFPRVGRKRQTRANAAVYRKFPAQRDRKRAK